MLTVALLGNSLALSGVGASLGARPGLRVAQLDPAAFDDAVRAVAPDVIVFDLSRDPLDVAALWRRHPGVRAVGLDLAGHRAIVYSRVSASVSTTGDLLRVIGARDGPVPRGSPPAGPVGSGARSDTVDIRRPSGDGARGGHE